jgi:hypothetical protein
MVIFPTLLSYNKEWISSNPLEAAFLPRIPDQGMQKLQHHYSAPTHDKFLIHKQGWVLYLFQKDIHLLV